MRNQPTDQPCDHKAQQESIPPVCGGAQPAVTVAAQWLFHAVTDVLWHTKIREGSSESRTPFAPSLVLQNSESQRRDRPATMAPRDVPSKEGSHKLNPEQASLLWPGGTRPAAGRLPPPASGTAAACALVANGDSPRNTEAAIRRPPLPLPIRFEASATSSGRNPFPYAPIHVEVWPRSNCKERRTTSTLAA